MKKLLLLLILQSLVQTLSFAQQIKIDSLQALLKTDREDTSRVSHLNQLAWILMNQNPDTSIILSKEALSLAEKLKWKQGVATAYHQLGWFAYLQGDYNHALDNYNKSIEISEDPKKKARTLGNIGSVYSELGEYDKALDYLEKALIVFEEYNDSARITALLGNMGIVYDNKGDYPRALDYYLRSLKIAEAIGDEKGEAADLANIGFVLYEQKEYAKSLDYYLRALKIADRLNLKQLQSNVLVNIGASYYSQNIYAEARDYFIKALKAGEEIGDKYGIALNLGNIGNVYYNEGEYQKALDYTFRALKMNTELSAKKDIAINLCNIGSIYSRIGMFKKAEEYLKNAAALGDSVGALNDLSQIEEALSQLYDTTGREKLALFHYRKAVALKDSIFNQEKNKQFTRNEMNYEFDKKVASAKAEQDKKDAVALQKLQKQKVIRNGFVGGFAIVLLFAGVFLRQRNHISKERKRSEELLLNILPSEVAEELKQKGIAEAKQFDDVTVMFTDFIDFTKISEKLSPSELVSEIHTCFKQFDVIISKYNIEKIKTIGDSYMCAGGLPVANNTNATDVVNAAIEIQHFMRDYSRSRKAEGKEIFEIRIGINTGPVVAGIVGVKKFAYDIWGDTVNIASRMESNSEAGKVNISESTYELVRGKFNCVHRGKIQAKNKGEIDMYFVEQL